MHRVEPPYDRLVRELLTARGSSYDNPAANYFRVHARGQSAMEKTAGVSGVRMVCAQATSSVRAWTRIRLPRCRRFFSAVGTRRTLGRDVDRASGLQ